MDEDFAAGLSLDFSAALLAEAVSETGTAGATGTVALGSSAFGWVRAVALLSDCAAGVAATGGSGAGAGTALLLCVGNGVGTGLLGTRRDNGEAAPGS